MDYKRFKIGDDVIVNQIVTSVHEEGKKLLMKTNVNIKGKIVGLKKLYTGDVCNGTVDPLFGCWIPAYLNITGTVICWKVQQGLLNKPVYVLDEDLERNKSSYETFPLIYQKTRKWTEEEKRNLKEDVKNQPRDARGRWITCKY